MSTYEMNPIAIREQKAALRRETAMWQKAALGLLAMSVAVNTAQVACINRLNAANQEAAAQLEQAERIRDYAVQQLGALPLQMEQNKQAQTELPVAVRNEEEYLYIGACIITAYCPCEACCGEWADGLTATGIPAEPGVVAVDETVIPIGSTVIIGGQRYLAADTGSAITGNKIDVCMPDHQSALDFGVQTADVWVVSK